MPRLCSICIHPARREIEKALVSGLPLRKIGTRFGTSVTALFRHRDGHLLVEAVKRERQTKEVARVDDVLGHVRTLEAYTELLFDQSQEIYRESRDAKDQRMALAAIREATGATREARGNAELVARLTGQLDGPGNIQVENMLVVLPRADRPAVAASPPAQVLDVPADKG
jgi:hypothetical protein